MLHLYATYLLLLLPGVCQKFFLFGARDPADADRRESLAAEVAVLLTRAKCPVGGKVWFAVGRHP